MGRVTTAVAVSLWAIPVSMLLNRIVPQPYMDEIFHIPQAQQYCRGNFRSWDPMITTPPGLYGLSLAYVASLFPGKWMLNLSQSDLCTTAILRSTNVVLAIICSILVYDIVIHLRPGIKERKATCYAILLGLYPLHWFFTFLYYTDVASLTAVLAMYLACLKNRFWVSAMFGAVAVLCRQTNVIWVIFVAANGAVAYVDDLYKKKHQENYDILVEKNANVQADKETMIFSPYLRKRQKASAAKSGDLSSASGARQLDRFPGLIGDIIDICKKTWCVKWRVLIAFTPVVFVLVSFAAFVFLNGGIVIGAKEAHVISPHFAQILYFGLASAAAAFPLHFSPSQVVQLFHLFAKNRSCNVLLISVAFFLSTICVHYYSIAHPYLLADNRHYTFYIWRRLIQAHWSMKYALIPLYVYSWFSIVTALGKEQKRIWVLSYIISVALVLVPAPLIEFRYFTIPLVFLIIHSPVMSESTLLLLSFVYAVVNILTMSLFLLRPFHWEHEHGTQRFMWKGYGAISDISFLF